MLHPVILCGGSGTRLWPSSRKAYPKQFVPLLGEKSLYQGTLARFSGEGFAAPLIMTGEDFRFLAVEQAAAVGCSDARVVVEPVGRDTAPAILAAALMLEDTPDDLMLVAPSDHVMEDVGAFHAALRAGRDAAVDGALVTFGVKPDRPETGYGYLQLAGRPDGVTTVTKFTEKPDLETAEAMLEAGHYLWNAGLFMGRIKDFIRAFETHAPDLVPPVRQAVEAAKRDLDFTRLDEAAFAAAPAISLDYAIMEKADWVVAVPLDCGWSDLGAWDALRTAGGMDRDGNALSGDVTAIDCEGSYLRSEEPNMTLVGLGLKDVVAVAMRDAVLVADRARVQDVKGVVETLRRAGKAQADEYPRFHRPWGWYETLCLDHRFQVKRIMVKPGGVLSLQSHRHRSEHWIVVAGTAEVTVDDEVKLVTENQGVYIPLGATHRMANPGKVPMYLIEVQTGAYLGEDDIVRYEDIYDRT
ncbi:MAG: mannose-1-phosphate guanylyltransferase/mannose-6-phosphate isomerase [Rhodobacteraceae bacterium]|nr:mannose-1-phosphate guanylyltransferase/mannose-6-phosphate isomerase [Silicimonas sp.]RZW10187.1 MAG: mannose-1-phosphate guanylyltransferase/mannose-6-phosphate isomerase [Paracoccaceae bacterium]